MRHDADVPRGIKIVGPERSVNEVVVRDAGCLVEAERDLELSHFQLGFLDHLEIEIHVLPLRLRCVPEKDVLVGQFLLGQLAFDFVVDLLEDGAFDADAVAVQLKSARRWQRFALTGQAGRVWIGTVRVFLQLRLEIQAEVLAEPERRVRLPHEADAPFDGRLVVGIVDLVGCGLVGLLLLLLLRRVWILRRLRRLPGFVLLRLLRRLLWLFDCLPRGSLQRDCRVDGGGRGLSEQEEQQRRDHTTTPLASAMPLNKRRTSATASASSTMIATSRRKSRLSAAIARLPTTAIRSSTSSIFPCDLRSPSRFAPKTSTEIPALRRSFSK